MTARRTDTPWGLSKVEQEVLDMVCLKGCQKGAASALQMHRPTVTAVITRARQRMEVDTNLLALLEWDRFAMGRDESEAT